MKKSNLKSLLLFLVTFQFYFNNTRAQTFTNDAEQREKHFVYEVKQIDEFFERFNDDSSSYIRKVYSIYHKQFKLDRKQLIKSLFNYETQDWDSIQIEGFVKTVLTDDPPAYLNFYHDGWYAEVNCLFKYYNSTIQIPVVMKIETDEGGGSRWVIASIRPNSLKSDAFLKEIIPPKHKNKFIDPESHANNFIALTNVFLDKQNFADYLDINFFDRKNSKVFYSELMMGRLHFLSVKSIKYHFLQIKGWIFSVNYFLRSALNSGWLINQLYQASDTDKDLYKKNLLEE
jgi:hypothetical protein